MSKDPFQFNQPFGGSTSTSNMAATIGDDYESKVRNFLPYEIHLFLTKN